jgi:hypothetical protein
MMIDAQVEHAMCVALTAATAFVAVAPCRAMPPPSLLMLVTVGLACLARSPNLAMSTVLISVVVLVRGYRCTAPASVDHFTVDAVEFLPRSKRERPSPGGAPLRRELHPADGAVTERDLQAFITPEHLLSAQSNAVPHIPDRDEHGAP